MKKTKLLSMFAAAVLLVAVFAGCGGGSSSGSTEHVTIVFSHNQPVGSPEDIGAEVFKAKMEELAGDRVTVEVYPASQLGALREQVESTQMGEINITMQPISVVTPFVDDIKIADFPYILPPDRNKVFEVMDGPVGMEGLEPLAEAGFHGFGYWFAGYKLFTTKGFEVHEPADFVGKRMRVMESPLLISQYAAWGATAVPIAYAEVYNSLQQGVVDGQENPVQTVVLNNYHEVQDYAIQGYHGTMTYILMANKEWFDGLDSDMQKWIIEAEYEGRVTCREEFAIQEQGYIDTINDYDGCTYYEFTDAEVAAFREASLPVYDEHTTNEWQTEYLQKLMAAFE